MDAGRSAGAQRGQADGLRVRQSIAVTATWEKLLSRVTVSSNLMARRSQFFKGPMKLIILRAKWAGGVSIHGGNGNERPLKFIASIEGCSGLDVALALINFAADCITGVRSNLKPAVDALEKQTRRHASQSILCGHCTSGSLRCAADAGNIYQALQQIRKQADALYRYDLWFDTLRLFGPDADLSLPVADRAKQMRDNHAVGRRIASNAVSQTLLIKGLEFAHAFIPNASCFIDKKRPRRLGTSMSRPRGVHEA